MKTDIKTRIREACFSLSAEEKKRAIDAGIDAAGVKRGFKTIGAGTLLGAPPIGAGLLAAGYLMKPEQASALNNKTISDKEKQYFDKGYAATNAGKYHRNIGNYVAGSSLLSGGLLLSLRNSVPLNLKPALGVAGVGLLGGLAASKVGYDKLRASRQNVYREEGIVQ